MASPGLAEQTVLVTGAGGFIGNHVVKELTMRGARVRALIGHGDPIRPWPRNRVQVTEVDVREPDLVAPWLAGVETVVHLAGPASVRDSFSSAATYAEIHVGGTARTLQLICAAGVQRFVYISSAEVYGQPLDNPVHETHRLQARSPYAAAKIGAERFVESFTETTPEFQAVILRPFSVYGPGQSTNSLLGTILRQLKHDDRIRLADLRPRRDYCYATDVAAAIAQACSLPMERLTTINVGSGVGHSVADVAKLAAQAAGQEVSISQTNDSDRPAGGNISELVADCRRAQQVLQWKPTVGLLEGLRRTIEASKSD